MIVPILLSLGLLLTSPVNEAEKLFAKGRWAEARAVYSRALEGQKDPAARARLLDRIGETLLYEGRIWPAESRFAASLEEMETGSARHHLARVYFRAAREAMRDPSTPGVEVRSLLSDAAREAKRAAELLPSSADVQVTLGLVERYLNDVDAEQRALTTALRLAPGHPEASLQLAWRREVQNRLPEARRILESVAEDARGVELWVALGRVAARTGDEEIATRSYAEAAIRAPESFDVFNGLWNVTARKKRFLAFTRAMERVLKARPGAWLPHYYLGFAHLDNGKPEKAVESFRNALALKPDLTRARVMIAQIYLENLAREDKAVQLYVDVLERDPENQRARAAISKIAMARAEGGRHEEAARLFGILAKADPGNPVHTMNRALALKELGRFEEALALYEKIEKEFPLNPRIPNDRGLLLMGMGRDEEAMAAFREALNRDDEFLDTLENLGAYALLGNDRREALRWFLKAYGQVRRAGGDPSKFRRYLDLVAGELSEWE